MGLHQHGGTFENHKIEKGKGGDLSGFNIRTNSFNIHEGNPEIMHVIQAYGVQANFKPANPVRDKLWGECSIKNKREIINFLLTIFILRSYL